jgi:hypothetical protein
MAKDTDRTQAEQDSTRNRDLDDRNTEEIIRGGADSDVRGIASDEEDDFEDMEDTEDEEDDEASM